MIDIALLRDDESKEHVKQNLARRGVDPTDIDKLAQLDEKWRSLSTRLDELRSQKNKANEHIARASDDKRATLVKQMKQVDEEEKKAVGELETISEQRNILWQTLPNLIADGVPEGSEEDYEVVEESAHKPAKPQFKQQDYLTLMGDRIDVKRAAKVSGSRFVHLVGELARLEIALVSFAMDLLTKEGFTPIIPPVLIKEEPMAGMGYLDHEGDEIYKTQDNLYLVGTSEQSIGPMHMNEILDEQSLPLRYVGFSSCFRREAGSHGKDVKGMLRVHQFDKVEMFSFTDPDTSEREHTFILDRQKQIMDGLELPYRVTNIAAGDLAAPSAKTYDIETWIPSEQRYRETNSTSNTTDFQARRLHIRTKKDGRNVYIHMLNGTAVAVGRVLIALIENHQQQDGSITIPNVLHSYLPFTTIRPPKNSR